MARVSTEQAPDLVQQGVLLGQKLLVVPLRPDEARAQESEAFGTAGPEGQREFSIAVARGVSEGFAQGFPRGFPGLLFKGLV